jgi:hypothetical protein
MLKTLIECVYTVANAWDYFMSLVPMFLLSAVVVVVAAFLISTFSAHAYATFYNRSSPPLLAVLYSAALLYALTAGLVMFNCN